MNRISARAKCATRLFIPICAMAFSGVAFTQSKAANVHPIIGDKPPKELMASDILALPEREQQAWIHGAVTLTAQSLFETNKDKALCVLDWYFEGDGAEVLYKLLQSHSDRAPTSIVFAATNSICSRS